MGTKSLKAEGSLEHSAEKLGFINPLFFAMENIFCDSKTGQVTFSCYTFISRLNIYIASHISNIILEIMTVNSPEHI